MRWLRRTLAISCVALAGVAGFASLTVARGDRNLPLATAGMAFDGAATGRILRTATQASVASQTPVPEELATLVDEALAAEPLNYAAHSAIALQMRQADDPDLARFVELASQVRPRTPSTIGLSMELASKDGDLNRVLRLLDRLHAVRPQLVRTAMPSIVAELEKAPETVDYSALLAREPSWAPIFLSEAIGSEQLLPLVAQGRVRAPDADVSNDLIDAAMVRKLVANGDFDTAWSLYELSSGSRTSGGLSMKDAKPPFDWELFQTAGQNATVKSDGTLEISLSSGGAVAAKQIVRIPAGANRLTGSISRSGTTDHDLIIRLGCAEADGSTREVARIPARATALDVPIAGEGSCRYRTLEIATDRTSALQSGMIELRNLAIR